MALDLTIFADDADSLFLALHTGHVMGKLGPVILTSCHLVISVILTIPADDADSLFLALLTGHVMGNLGPVILTSCHHCHLDNPCR